MVEYNRQRFNEELDQKEQKASTKDETARAWEKIYNEKIVIDPNRDFIEENRIRENRESNLNDFKKDLE